MSKQNRERKMLQKLKLTRRSLKNTKKLAGDELRVAIHVRRDQVGVTLA